MSIGRPKEFDPNQVLSRAMDVFWAQGYKNTSLQDLLDATGLSKSSLYQTYGNKQQLFEAAVEYYYSLLAKEMRSRLAQVPTGFAFIEGFLNEVVREAEGSGGRRGCLLVNTANECGQHDEVIAAAVSRGFNRFKGILKDAIQKGRLDNSIASGVDDKYMAHYLLSSMAGLRTMAKGGASAKELRHVIAIILLNLEPPVGG